MSFVPSQTFGKTAFGELANVEATPSIQIGAQYGIRENLQVITVGTGASVTSANSNFIIQSGTSSTGYSSCLTRKQTRYKAGQGVLARFSAVFENNAANSQQIAGLITAEDSYSFGYNGSVFGILTQLMRVWEQ